MQIFRRKPWTRKSAVRFSAPRWFANMAASSSLAVLCVVFAVLNPRFLAFNNFMNIMQQVAVIAVAAYGMTYVILLGEIDLSIGSIIAVSGMVAAQAFAMGFGFCRPSCSRLPQAPSWAD